jgi:Cu-Zn family superoxide dismutase
MSAGAHFNPTAMKHGLENPDGPHAGDMPNMTLDDQGSGTYNTTTTMFTLGQGENSLLDADGSALVIHAAADDQVTDPSGNSGDRVVCGVITADAATQ